MIKTRADLFEAAAKMMRMCDEAGVEYAYKQQGQLNSFPKEDNFWPDKFAFSCAPKTYEFPLAIVEDKPVWKGDVLYYKQCTFAADSENDFSDIQHFSWNPPRKTITEKLMKLADDYADNAAALERLRIPERRKTLARHFLEYAIIEALEGKTK